MAEYNPDAVFNALEEAAEGWVNAQFQADQLEKMGEILLARLMLEAKADGEAIGLCKESARATDTWETHINGELVARRIAERAKAKYKNMQALADARRTQESTMRTLTR